MSPKRVRELILVFRRGPRAVLDHAPHRRGVEWQCPSRWVMVVDEQRIGLVRSPLAVHAIGEIGLHLKELLEVLVIRESR